MFHKPGRAEAVIVDNLMERYMHSRYSIHKYIIPRTVWHWLQAANNAGTSKHEADHPCAPDGIIDRLSHLPLFREAPCHRALSDATRDQTSFESLTCKNLHFGPVSNSTRCPCTSCRSHCRPRSLGSDPHRFRHRNIPLSSAPPPYLRAEIALAQRTSWHSRRC